MLSTETSFEGNILTYCNAVKFNSSDKDKTNDGEIYVKICWILYVN